MGIPRGSDRRVDPASRQERPGLAVARTHLGTPQRWTWLALLAIVLAVGITYARVGTLGFVYDDHRLVELNPLLGDESGPLAFITTGLSGTGEWQLYRPATGISWWIDRALFGQGPAPLHVINVVWHLIAVCALVWCVSELARVDHANRTRRDESTESVSAGSGGLPLALAVGAFFALHPLNSEPVLWISRRADLMAGAFVLVALAAAIRGCRLGAMRWLVMSAVSSGLALGSKEIALLLPPLLAVVVLVVGSEDRRRRAMAWGLPASVAAMIAVQAIVRVRLFGSVSGQPAAFVQNPLIALDVAERLLAAAGLVAHYARLVVLPRPLSADYSWRSLELSPASSVVGTALVLAGLVAFVWGWRRSRMTTIGIVLLATTYVPISNSVVLIGAAFAERFAYLPLAGLLVTVSGLVLHVVGTRGAARRAPSHAAGARKSAAGGRAMLGLAVPAIVCVAALAACVVVSHRRVDDWRDDGTLFAATLEAYPSNVVARTYVAIDARGRGDLDAAAAHYDRILEQYPDYHLARVNRALIDLDRGNPARAASEMRWVTERDPFPGAAHYVYGLAEEELGRVGSAEREFWLATRDGRARRDALEALTRLYRRIGNEAGLERARRAMGSGAN